MTPDQILASLMALTSPETNAHFDQLVAGGHDDRYPVAVEPCDYPPGPLEVEGTTMICGTVSVPEDYDLPEGRRIPLEFAVFGSLSRSPAADPLIYLHGGPASGTLDMLGPVANRLYLNHRRTRDIVTFDQRASALSSTTVQCYSLVAENLGGLVEMETGTGPGVDLGALTAPCIEEIKASGADLSAYNTENNAHDVRSLMTALGYPEYNIYGISYGTQLGLEVLRSFPEGVRSAVLDGVAPASESIYVGLLEPYADMTEALVTQCAEDEACNTAYPDLGETMKAAFARITEEPIPASRGRAEITADDLQELTYDMRNNWHDLRPITPYLPRIYAELAEGDTTTIDAFFEDYGQSEKPPSFNAGGLSPDEAALVETIASLAFAMDDMSDAASAALMQLRSDLSTTETSITVAEAFEARSNELVQTIPDRANRLDLVRDYALLQRGDQTAEALADWVSTYFPEPGASDLLALISVMSEEDLARTFEIIDDEATKYEVMLGGLFNGYIYWCQEQVPFNSMEKFNAYQDELALAWPFLDTPDLRDFGAMNFGVCEMFEQHPREGFHELVETDIPVLSMNGLLDHQTSWKWGEAGTEAMTNARNVVVPEAGHGSIAYQPCANDITVAFLNDPSAELDTSCTEDIKVDFLMPDAPLPW